MEPERSIAVIGGGAAGWLAAATLARVLPREFCRVCLVESGSQTSGYSESVLPAFHRLNRLLGINERDLVARTRGTFRLAARFVDWGNPASDYLHASGAIGAKLDAVPFHHYWLRLRQQGEGAALEEYSTAALAARGNRFAMPGSQRTSFLSSYSYGYHFHSDLFAAYLQEYALAHGVMHLPASVVDVDAANGFIAGLRLDDGSRLSADLYVDCAGPAGPVFARMFSAEYEDWSRWLACDSAVSILCAADEPLSACTDVIAATHGWRWHTPLQKFSERGMVYSSGNMSDEAALATLFNSGQPEAVATPRTRRWKPGRPARFWEGNCLTLTGCGLEPLESTRLHLVQTGVARLLTLFPVCAPGRYGWDDRDDRDEYNRLAVAECEGIRDFLILHYRTAADIPDSLQSRIELFRHSGRIELSDDEHFGAESWLAVLLGQGVIPQDYDPLADVLAIEEVRAALARMRSMVADGVAGMPTLTQFMGGWQ